MNYDARFFRQFASAAVGDRSLAEAFAQQPELVNLLSDMQRLEPYMSDDEKQLLIELVKKALKA